LGQPIGGWSVLRENARNPGSRVRLDSRHGRAGRPDPAGLQPDDLRGSDRPVIGDRTDAGDLVGRFRIDRPSPLCRRPLRGDVVCRHAANAGNRRPDGTRRHALCRRLAHRSGRVGRDRRRNRHRASLRVGAPPSGRGADLRRRAVDGPTIAGASCVLAFVALGAAMLPAWRAASIRPSDALRFE